MDNKEILVTSKITTKGQITIPKVIREKLNLDEGDVVIFLIDKKGNITISNAKDCKVENKDVK